MKLVMENTVGICLAYFIGALPVLGMLVWWWNEIWYALPTKFRLSGTGLKLPPGHMGLPYFGEMFVFLWYFKILRRPDDYINSKRKRYGDGAGLYRSYLFGSPSIIAVFPMPIKLVLQSDNKFMQKWPTPKLMGTTSMVVVHGKEHARVRSLVTNFINRPDALRKIAAVVQPGVVASLESWAQKGKIIVREETKNMTLVNIGKVFARLEPGQELDAMDKLFSGLVKGFRSQPLNLPGTTYHNAFQCRMKLEAMFKEKLEEKKNKMDENADKIEDLMDGLMRVKDEEGNQMSDQQVVDNIVSLIIGGYGSTSLATMWTVYHLAKNPDVLQKVRDENMALREKKQGDFITSDDVSTLKYTNKVVEETIRLANIAGFVFRQAAEDVEFKGYVIPKNWKVVCWIRYLHENQEYFEDAMHFNPDRWNVTVRPAAHLVFGAGPRICAGNMLARMQLAIFIYHMSTGYKWKLVNPDAGMVYLPHPAPVDGIEAIFSKI